MLGAPTPDVPGDRCVPVRADQVSEPLQTASSDPTSGAPSAGEPRSDAALRPRSPYRRSSRPHRLKGVSPWILAAGVLVALLVVVAGADLAFSWGRIQPGVHIGPVAVGSMTAAEAGSAIDRAFLAAADRPISVTCQTETFTVSADSIGARLDATASVDAAMAVGREGGVLSAAWQRVSALFSGAEVTPTVHVDPDASDAALDRIDAAAELAPRDATVTLHGTEVTVTKARQGRALDRSATREAVAAAALSARGSVAAVVDTVAPDVTDADALAARAQAVRLIAGPVTVKFESDTVTVARETVAGWVSFSRDATAAADASSHPFGGLTVAFVPKRLAAAVAPLAEGRTRPGKDARFVVKGRSIRITQSQVGEGPDLKSLAFELAAACLGTGPRTAVLRLAEAEPRLTTDEAKAMGIHDRLSTYTTVYATVNPSRTNNVHLLAKALDGKLVAPGEVFSFNGAAGQRTAAKGYQEAPAIVKGKLVPQLGGGVCQVGTTVFNAVFFSGLPVVERHNHSFFISHYPTGRDATVSWGYPDFKFRNDTGGWVLVDTSFTSNTLTVALYGTDPGYRVKYTTGPFTDVIKHKTVETPDPKLAKGTRIVEDAGVDGRTVVVTRTVYKGSVVVRKDTFVSHYSPKTEFVRVGTKQPSSTPTDTVKP